MLKNRDSKKKKKESAVGLEIADIDKFGLIKIKFTTKMVDQSLGFNLKDVNSETFKIEVLDLKHKSTY